MTKLSPLLSFVPPINFHVPEIVVTNRIVRQATMVSFGTVAVMSFAYIIPLAFAQAAKYLTIPLEIRGLRLSQWPYGRHW
jgi:hypothetical protein